MKLKVLATVLTLTIIGLATAAKAEDPEQVKQLLTTHECKNCNLDSADLSGTNLNHADLSGANLTNAKLSGADLNNADLSDTNLSNADLSNANLSTAQLTGAKLYIANLSNANLIDAKLNNVNLVGANLSNADLSGTNLSSANLNYATLTNTNLTNADLSGADLSDAKLSGAKLQIANLSSTNLNHADLSGADLSKATLQDTNLTNANLTGTIGLTDQQLATPSSETGEKIINPRTSDSSGLQENRAENLQANFKLTPLEKPPIRLFNLETANQLSAGAVSTSVNVHFFPTDQVGQGSGLQVYNASIDWGVNNRLQVGLAGAFFDDKLGRLVNGERPFLQFGAIAPNVKYQILKDDKFSLSALGSLDVFRLSTNPALFNATNRIVVDNYVAGSLQVPLTYSLNPELQLHLTPAVAFFPDTLQGAPFYGTFFNLGGGVSWQPLKRVNLFADANFPIGPGGNAVNSQNGAIVKRVVWSAGLRYLVNPAVGLDLYATNAFGATPATRLLSFIPDSDQTAIGFNLNYIPDLGQGYSSSFSTKPRVRLSERDTQLLLDGLTLTTADTLLPEMIRLRGGLGAGTSFNVAYGLTNDLQLEFIVEEFERAAGSTLNSFGLGTKFGAAAKIRLLDQVQGDPFSASIRVAFAQDTFSKLGFSVIELPLLYRPIPQVGLFLNPKAGIGGANSLVGTGLGVNYELLKGLQVIGEFTPLLTGERSVWSVGLRYLYPELNLGVDLYASNAIGQNALLGGLVAQPNGGTSVGFNIHWLFGGVQRP